MKSLERLGLTESEQAIYTSLLRLGEATVAEIAKDSGVHRTNIYTLLDKLLAMGLATEYNEENVKHFRAAHPENLLRYLQETKEELAHNLEALEELYNASDKPVTVDTYHGRKGMKAAFQEIVRTNRDGIGFGIAGQLRKHLPVYAKQWIRDLTEQKNTHKYLYAEGTAFEHEQWEVRTISEEYITPVSIQVYGDKTFISIWEPAMVAIIITSEDVADNFRKHFELLWQLGN